MWRRNSCLPHRDSSPRFFPVRSCSVKTLKSALFSMLSESETQPELKTSRLSTREDPAEVRSEIGILAGDAPVWMIQDVEALRAELQHDRFMNGKTPMQRHVYHCDAWSRQYVAPGIAERVGLRVRKCVHVEPLLRGPLAPRLVQALAGNNVRPVRRSRIREI